MPNFPLSPKLLLACSLSVAMLAAGSAHAYPVYPPSKAYTDAKAVAAAQAAGLITAAQAPVQAVCAKTGSVAITASCLADFASAATTAATGITSFTNPNIAMPNGGHLAHPIFIGAYPTAKTITGTAAQSVFSGSGAGSLTMAAGVFNYLGAQFELRDAGVASTGLANVATVTANVLLGSTSLISQATTALPINVATIPFVSDIICTVMSTGATGTVGCHGSIRFGSGLASVSPFETYLIATAPVTVDLTSALTWDAQATLSSAIGSPSLKVYSAEIWQLN